MDGHQQGDRPNFSTTFQPASILDHPGVTKPAGGVARAMAFVKGMSRKAFILMGVVGFLQFVMPEGWKPSDIIGGFHGNTEKAELLAKQEVAAEYERTLTDAKAKAATQWQMEAEAFRQQQEAMARSLGTLETAVQIADAACLSAPLATLFMGNTRDARELQTMLQGACAEAARIRAKMTSIQAETARLGSALMQRSIPAPMPNITVPAPLPGGSVQTIPSATRSR
jgi:hypothetical protein